MTREELIKRFNSLEGMDDEELLNFAYHRFVSNQDNEMTNAIAEYIKTKAINKNNKKTTPLEQNGPRLETGIPPISSF